jgi:2-keto-4-pentenoate hydratase/2-oxohepta-3-ene-1,7-dioic acid hydratase in catechol pathway
LVEVGFRFANVASRAALVDDDGDYYDLERLTGGVVAADPMAALLDADVLHAAQALLESAAPDGSLAAAEVGPPVPTPRNVFGIGLNYAEHVAETGKEVSESPVIFTKFPSCIVGPNADIELRSEHADYEIEMVVVIGRGGRDIAAADAWDHVLGLTAGQDISDRVLQFAAKPPHFDLAKSRDTYGPLGPVLVSADMFTDCNDLALTCAVNGETQQDSRTSNMIFSVAELIAYISAALTLAPGDIIFTGTPDGVGVAKGVCLQPGDVITSGVEGIGTLTNRCV